MTAAQIPRRSRRRMLRDMINVSLITPYRKAVTAPRRQRANAAKSVRRLEIGPGAKRLLGFETLNIVSGPDVDYIADASRRLPFGGDTFDIVYASHVLEHFPWYLTQSVLAEWIRILKRGGRLEIWVPDGELICKSILDASQSRRTNAHLDGWKLLNPQADPFLWANGRLFYGANGSYPSWHKAVFTAASLAALFDALGLVDIRRAQEGEYRGGANHGAINLGVFGTKP